MFKTKEEYGFFKRLWKGLWVEGLEQKTRVVCSIYVLRIPSLLALFSLPGQSFKTSFCDAFNPRVERWINKLTTCPIILKLQARAKLIAELTDMFPQTNPEYIRTR
jgi:hypothetical protein